MSKIERIIVVAVVILLSIGAFGIYQANNPQPWFGLRLTHDGAPLQQVDVSICFNYCSPNTFDFKQGATGKDGVVIIRFEFQLFPSILVVHSGPFTSSLAAQDIKRKP